MENQRVLENLDSLWFFATVFSTRTPPPTVAMIEDFTPNDSVEAPGEEIATPILQNQQNIEWKTIEEVFSSEMKTEGEISPIGKGMEKEEKRRKNRGRRSMDLSYAVKEICECWLFEEGIGNGEKKQKKKKKKMMPPFEDGMAMKEHIKSWAYAVACTVR